MNSTKGTETWTSAQYRAHMKGRKPVTGKQTSPGEKQKWEIETAIKLMGLMETSNKAGKKKKPLSAYQPGEYTKELVFSDERSFRFDWAIPALRVAIEYEGIFGGGKSGHTTAKGYTKDTEKYNLAAAEGWTVLRYTAKNYRNVTQDLNKILNNKTAQATATL